MYLPFHEMKKMKNQEKTISLEGNPSVTKKFRKFRYGGANNFFYAKIFALYHNKVLLFTENV